MPGSYSQLFGNHGLGRPDGYYPCSNVPAFAGPPQPTAAGPFRSRYGVASYRIAGISEDSQGNPLAGCIVKLFRVQDDALITAVQSDAGGRWAALVGDTATTYYAVFFNPADSTVSGSSPPTLVGS